ncbi:MAG: PAS domain-containing protein [bacterium]|nr:PAS domain-containing protein [bacterium]
MLLFFTYSLLIALFTTALLYLISLVFRRRDLLPFSHELLQIIPNSLVVLDESFLITYINPRTVALFGYREDELIGKNIKLLFEGDESYDSFRKKLNVVVSNHLSLEEEITMSSAYGYTIPIQVTAKSFFDKKSQSHTIFLICTSLKELTDKTIALAQSKAQDYAILSSIGDGMIVTDAQQNISMMNNTALQMTGLELKDVIGRTFIDVIPLKDNAGNALTDDELPITLAFLSGEKVTTSSIANTLYLRKSDTSLYPVAITVTPIKLQETIEGTITLMRDITYEKEVDKMKTEFISLVSHQLKTPLSALRWFSGMLLEEIYGKLSSEQKEIGENIHGSTLRMITLVNGLLDISRLEAGRIIHTPVMTDLKKLLESIITELQLKIDEKRQHIHIDTSSELSPISVDPDLVRQVYLNFLTNAIKYTPEEGDIYISIEIAPTMIISKVRDTGYGIPQKDTSRVFQKFYRGENILKYEADGNGFGLYLAKAIVESFGGVIGFESQEGKGSVFWFSIPIQGMKPKEGELQLNS